MFITLHLIDLSIHGGKRIHYINYYCYPVLLKIYLFISLLLYSSLYLLFFEMITCHVFIQRVARNGINKNDITIFI